MEHLNLLFTTMSSSAECSFTKRNIRKSKGSFQQMESVLALRDIVSQLCDFSGLDSEKTMLLTPYAESVQKSHRSGNTCEAEMGALKRNGWNESSLSFDGPVDVRKLSADLSQTPLDDKCRQQDWKTAELYRILSETGQMDSQKVIASTKMAIPVADDEEEELVFCSESDRESDA